MKILVLTKNNPIEIVDVVNKIRSAIYYDEKKCFCDSPQMVAWELEEMKGIPYLYSFFPAIKTFEKNKEQFYDAVDVFITVGTTDINSADWYDVIVGLNNPEIQDYYDFDTSIHQCDLFTLKNADIKFDTTNELLFFIRKLIRMEK